MSFGEPLSPPATDVVHEDSVVDTFEQDPQVLFAFAQGRLRLLSVLKEIQGRFSRPLALGNLVFELLVCG